MKNAILDTLKEQTLEAELVYTSGDQVSDTLRRYELSFFAYPDMVAEMFDGITNFEGKHVEIKINPEVKE